MHRQPLHNESSALNLSRRNFLAHLAGGVTAATVCVESPVAVGAPQVQAAPERTAPGWIDAHVHVWHPDTNKYPIASSFQKSDMRPPSFTPEELLSHCRPEGVSRIVLIQMSFYQFDHQYMLEAMRSHPGVFSAVALIDFHSANLDKRVDELAAAGVRGFRVHAKSSAKEWVEDAGMHALWKRATKRGLAVCPLINPSDLTHVDALCQKFPETIVVVDHFARIGMSGQIELDRLNELCELSRFPKVHDKTSAFYALGKKAPPYDDLVPMIHRLIDRFGVERLMWASDCPYQVQSNHTYAASIELIRDRMKSLSQDDKDWRLRKTAEKVFY